MDSISELMNKKEPLDEELQQWIFPGPLGGFALKHPLLFDMFYSEQLNAVYNAKLRFRREYIEKEIEKGNLAGAIFMHEKPHRFDAFMQYQSKMDDKTYWKILGEVWTNTENLWQYKDYVRDLLTSRDNPKQMMDEDGLELFNSLPDEVVVYRGYQTKNRKGFTWSLSYAKATMFARRYQPKKFNVIRGTIKKRDIIALLMHRNEFEIVAFHQSVKQQKIVKSLEREARLEAVLERAKAEFSLKAGPHGPAHWERVERNVLALCDANHEADREVCRVFALTHDCKRENDGDDPDHGKRAADFLKANVSLIPVSGANLNKLLEACRYHNDGQVSTDPTIGTCWDADRLDLPRVSVVPDLKLLSTEQARQLIWKI